MELEIVRLVNQDRQASGLAPLQFNAKLFAAAQIHSRDMAQLQEMDHTLSGVDQPTLQSRLDFVQYFYARAGENIAYDYADAAAVEMAWMNSSSHRANILNPHYTEIGVAIVYSNSGKPYYTQVFGRPI